MTNLTRNPERKQIIDLVNEIWKDAPGYEGYYMVSTMGRLKSLPYNRKNIGIVLKSEYLLKERIRLGYNRPMFWVKGKGKCVPAHRIIAMAFIPNPDNKPFINHKDGNGLNNNIENLEWCTNQENIIHAITHLGKMKGARKKASGTKNHKARKIVQLDINKNIVKVWGTTIAASANLNIKRTSISSALCGRAHTSGGFIWKYYDDYIKSIPCK